MPSRLKSLFLFIKRRRKTSIAIAVILVLLILIFRPKAPKEIATQKVTNGDIQETVSASGTVNAETSVDLSFPTGGKLVYLGAHKGDQISQGQTIASLDQRSVQKNLESALSDYAKQRNTFEQTKDNNNPSLSLDSQPAAIKRILQDNQYDLDKAVISVELQELAREQSFLTSPISGVLIRSDVTTAGVNVTPTTTFTVADPDAMIFKVDVDEADIGRIHLDEPVAITLDAFPDNTINASINKIDFASHATSTGGTAYTVQADLPANLAQTYRIGMNGDASIIVASRKNTLIIPLSSLIDETHVFVKTGKTFEKRAIKLGIQSDTEAQVLSGLKEGEQVALQPDDVTKQFPTLAK